MAEVYVLPKWSKIQYPGIVIDTTSNSGVYRGLSPFVLGPINTYVPGLPAQNFENLWQFSKVYSEHLAFNDWPSGAWYRWRDEGWADERAHRYPMGKGRKPEYSFWDGEKLSYIEARKRIYAAIYAKYVILTTSFSSINAIHKRGDDLILLDYDGYDYVKEGKSLVEVINDPNRKMGHAFVLAMILKGELQKCLNS